MKRICLLDMDGVLVDFADGACMKFLGHKVEDHDYDIASVCNREPDDFWPVLNTHFWWKLEWMHDGKEILDACIKAFGINNICIISSPPYVIGQARCAAEAVKGKLMWMESHLPSQFLENYQFFFGSSKWFFAHLGAVLVDDNDQNVIGFEEAGGRVILVPRPWNILKQESKNALAYVTGELLCLT